MDYEIKRTELCNLYHQLNHCLFLTKHNTLIKDCYLSDNYCGNFHEIAKYIKEIPFLNGYTRPISYFKENGKIYGYEMDYLQDYITLGTMLKSYNMPRNKQYTLEIKKLLLFKLLKCLKKLNQYYIVGDINTQNIMINEQGDAKIIDWENGHPINATLQSQYLYLYSLSFVDNEIQEDSLKMFFCALSLLYETDIEQLVRKLPSYMVFTVLNDLILEPNIRQYLADYAYELNAGSGRVIYFGEYLKNIKDISLSTIEEMREKIEINYHNF
ncbi:MAG: hypothetical protein E7164_05020 [Firmicutes bacterium]|nr:hypothetical protein [Bacillota bacterium]